MSYKSLKICLGILPLLFHIGALAQLPELHYLKTLPGVECLLTPLENDSSYVLKCKSYSPQYNASIFPDNEEYILNPSMFVTQVFYDQDFNMLGEFESGGEFIDYNSLPVKRIGSTFILDNIKGNSLNLVEFESQPMLTDFDPENFAQISFALTYDTELDELRMPLHCKCYPPSDNGISGNYAPLSRYEASAGTQVEAHTHRGAWLSDGTMFTALNMYREVVINWEEEISLEDYYWGTLWIKLDPLTNELTLHPLTSDQGSALTYNAYSSSDQPSLYRVGTVRGNGVLMSPDGSLWETYPGDSLYHVFLVKEDVNGNQQWATSLYTYNNAESDTNAVATSLRSRPISYGAVEFGEYFFLSHFSRLVTKEWDTLYYENMIDGSGLNPYPASDGTEPGNYLGQSERVVYKIDSETGQHSAQLTLPLTNQDPFHLSNNREQPCYLFKVGDKMAWIHKYDSEQDTTIYFIRHQGADVVDSTGIALPAGSGSYVLWLNEALDILESTLIPYETNDFNHRGVIINSISIYNEDSLMIAGNVWEGTTSTLDPNGLAEEQYYPETTGFIGFYSLPEVLVSVEDFELIESQKLSLYPNPASAYIILRTDVPTIGGYAIFDLTGREVASGDLSYNTNNLSIGVADLTQGTYFVSVLTESYMITLSFVKE